MESPSSSPAVRIEGDAGDLLLHADTDKAVDEATKPAEKDVQETPTEEAGTTQPVESSEHAEPTGTTIPSKDAEENLDKAVATQRLVRSVLYMRIAIPPAEEVSNCVLRAVLCGDKEELDNVVKRKRLKGVAVALTADDRQRTALHMAVGTRNVRMVRDLMQYWRRDLNQSLEDDLIFLDHRRDMFVQGVNIFSAADDGRSAEKITNDDVGRFEKWLSEERRRLLRVTELRCEECWRESVTARDDQGRTPLHWAASVCGNDDSLIHTLMTTGRADLSAKDATSGPDQAVFAAFKDQLRCPSSIESKTTLSEETCHVLNGNAVTANGYNRPALFPCDGEFHRRTGKLRRLRGKRKGCKSEAARDAISSRDVQQARDLDMRQGPDGLTATTAKVKWFCGALAKTAAKFSMRRRSDAEAFLLSIFEDFDRNGDGTLSIRQFREALYDINVRVSEQTLLEVGRYFQAPTLKSRDGRHECHPHDSRRGDTRRRRDRATDWALVEISYVPLMDIVFGRKDVRGTRRRSTSKEKGTDDGPDYGQEMCGQRREITAVYHPDAYSNVDCDNGSDEDEDCYVDIGRIRAERVAVVEAIDALGRPPLFLAAASGAVLAAKTLIRYGAASARVVDGTGLTPYSVAPSLLMKRTLAAEARQSLGRAISKRTDGRGLTESLRGTTVHHDGEQLGATVCGTWTADETRRMEMCISTLAEDELASARACESRVDQKTSLHLAAAAGLPASVEGLLRRGIGESENGERKRSAGKARVGAISKEPVWKASWKLSDDTVRDPPLSKARCVNDHQNTPPDTSDWAAVTTDANGWSALHACCTEDSPQHYSCAIALLGSQMDPNARTNTGKTPLHVAASASGSPEGNLIPLLVSHGSDLEARDADGLRPIHVAAKTGHHTALLALLVAGADPWSVTSRGWSALQYSVASGTIRTTRLLAYWGSDYGVFARGDKSTGRTSVDSGRADYVHMVMPTIWEAAALGETERVSRACLFSSRSPKDTLGKPWACPGVNHKTPGLGFSPLHACMAGLAAVTRGHDVSLPCNPPRPRSHSTNVSHRPSLYARLARGCGEPARRHWNRLSNTQKRKGSARLVLRDKPAGVFDGRGDYIGVCQTLLSAAADVDALDNRCRTPLALAAAAGSVDMVEMLLRAGANPRACDTDGNTPLHFAFSYANVAVAVTLSKEKGVDQDACNRDGKTPQEVAGLGAGLSIGGSSASGEEPC